VGRRVLPFAARKRSAYESAPVRSPVRPHRGQRVILDADLAQLYGTTTKRFNEAFRRNASRFPKDFTFQLTSAEAANLKSQFATSSVDVSGREHAGNMRSQFVITSGAGRHGGRRVLPRVFTEHGAVMAANVLRSPKAVEMSV
jgi:hypothetical protein